MLSEETIVLLDDIIVGNSKHSIYYFQGNFYYPFMVEGFQRGRVRRAMREFKKTNSGLMESDRKSPQYLTKIQIYDSQFPDG